MWKNEKNLLYFVPLTVQAVKNIDKLDKVSPLVADPADGIPTLGKVGSKLP